MLTDVYCRSRPNDKGRITGGEVVEKHSIPWQVALVDKIGAKPSCGGMIINTKKLKMHSYKLRLNIVSGLIKAEKSTFDY